MTQDIRKLINSLNPWFCPVSIQGIAVTPGVGSTWDAERLTNRIKYRQLLIVDEVKKRYSLKDKYVLDLACNCGFWSARYAENGASKVVGVEGRESVLKQAQLYWSSNKFLPPKAYEFVWGDVANMATWKKIREKVPFHITICAGILYHVPDYRYILTQISNVTKEAIVVDTRVTDGRETIEDEKKDLHFNAIAATRKKVVPNIDRLLAHLSVLGFHCEILPVTFKSPVGLTDQDDYNKKRRITVLAKR